MREEGDFITVRVCKQSLLNSLSVTIACQFCSTAVTAVWGAIAHATHSVTPSPAAPASLIEANADSGKSVYCGWVLVK